jgi:hypothetical protein
MAAAVEWQSGVLQPTGIGVLHCCAVLCVLAKSQDEFKL